MSTSTSNTDVFVQLADEDINIDVTAPVNDVVETSETAQSNQNSIVGADSNDLLAVTGDPMNIAILGVSVIAILALFVSVLARQYSKASVKVRKAGLITTVAIILGIALITIFSCTANAFAAEPIDSQFSITAPTEVSAVLDPVTGEVDMPDTRVTNNSTDKSYVEIVSASGASIATAPTAEYTAVTGGKPVDGSTLKPNQSILVNWSTSLSGVDAVSVLNQKFAKLTYVFKQAVLEGTVTVSGDAIVGKVLNASVLVRNDALEFVKYQWYRDSVAIDGATSDSYNVVKDDVGHTLKCSVSTPSGEFSGSIESAQTSVVPKIDVSAPSVVVTGTPGVDKVLTAAVSGLPADGGSIVKYQWQRSQSSDLSINPNFTDIPKATSQTYTTIDGQFGRYIRCKVTVANAIYSIPVSYSNNLKIVKSAIGGGATVVTGDPVVGSTLTASIEDQPSVGVNSPKYVWYRNDGGTISQFDTFTMPVATGSNWQATRLGHVYPGQSYRLDIGSSELIEGSATEYTVLVLNRQANGGCRVVSPATPRNVFPISSEKQTLEFTVHPNANVTNELEVIVYNGVSGQTRGNSIKFNDVKLECLTPDGYVSVTGFSDASNNTYTVTEADAGKTLSAVGICVSTRFWVNGTPKVVGPIEDKAQAVIYSDGSMTFGRSYQIDESKTILGKYEIAEAAENEFPQVDPSAPEPAWLEHADIVKNVTFVGQVKPESMKSWFKGMKNLTTIDIPIYKLDSRMVIDASHLFEDCTSLTTLGEDFYWEFGTDQLRLGNDMFNGCVNLESIDFQKFKPSFVENFDRMFKDCRNMKVLGMSYADMGFMMTANEMFMNCESIEELDFSHTNISFDRVMSANGMLDGMVRLQTVIVGDHAFRAQLPTPNPAYIPTADGFWYDDAGKQYIADTVFYGPMTYSAVPPAKMYAMVYDDGSMVFQRGDKPDVGKTLTASYTDFEDVDEANFTPGWSVNAPNVTSVEFKDGMAPKTVESYFAGMTNLSSLNVSKLDMSNVTNTKNMFRDCSSLTSIDLSDKDFSSVTHAYSMFQGCSNAESIVLKPGGFYYATNINSMFRDCTVLKDFDISVIETASVTDANSLFYGCKSLTNIDFTKNDVGRFRSFSSMFRDCASLETLDISNFDNRNCLSDNMMFSGSVRLREITLGDKFSFRKPAGSTTWTVTFDKPNKTYIPETDGCWYDAAGTKYLNVRDIPDCVATTYYATPPSARGQVLAASRAAVEDVSESESMLSPDVNEQITQDKMIQDDTATSLRDIAKSSELEQSTVENNDKPVEVEQPSLDAIDEPQPDDKQIQESSENAESRLSAAPSSSDSDEEKVTA